MREPLLIDDQKKRTFIGKAFALILFLPLVLYIFGRHQIAEVAVGGKLPKIVIGTAVLCGNVVAGQPECDVSCAHGFELQCTWDPKCGGTCDGDYLLLANRLCPAPAPPPTAEEDLWHKATQARCCTCTPNMGTAMSAAIQKQIENGAEYPRMMPPMYDDWKRPVFFDDGGDVVFAPPPPANPRAPPPPPASGLESRILGMQPPPPSAPPGPQFHDQFYSSAREFGEHQKEDDKLRHSVDDTYTPKAPAAPPFYPRPEDYMWPMEPPWPMAPDGSQPIPPDILRAMRRPMAPDPQMKPYEPYQRVHHNAAVMSPPDWKEPIHPPKAPPDPLEPSVNTRENLARDSSILAHDNSVRGNSGANSAKKTQKNLDQHASTHGDDATDEELHSAMNFIESLPDHV